MLKDPKVTKQGIMQLLVRATPENRKAVINLFPAAKKALDSGYIPDVRQVPLHSWRCLLTLLADIASMQTDTDVFLRMSNDLLAIADRMVPPADALRQSAEILVHTFHADLYICRMRDKQGNWRATSAACPDGGPIPIVANSLEEDLPRHPVMRAVSQGHELYILSNDLHGIERGGESFDCVSYKAGYRARLSFVLREHNDEVPFGLVMLYSRQEFGFEQFDERFLGRCARLINLTVGRRVALARDTLEKAAGAMAHYGNNALNTMRVQAEYCRELADGMSRNASDAIKLTRQILAELPGDSRTRRMARELEHLLLDMEMSELTIHLDGVLDGTRRMTRIIRSLQKSAERPRLLKYVQGVDVLKLEDGRTNNDD